MRRILRIGLATLIVAATFLVLTPRQSEAHRWGAYYGGYYGAYYGGPVRVYRYRPVYRYPRVVYRPRVAYYPYYAAPVTTYYGGYYGGYGYPCW